MNQSDLFEGQCEFCGAEGCPECMPETSSQASPPEDAASESPACDFLVERGKIVVESSGDRILVDPTLLGFAPGELADGPHTIGPAIAFKLDFPAYLASPAINQGALSNPTPKHVREELVGGYERDDTADLRLGRIMHARILEGEQALDRFVVPERCSATKKGDGQPCENMGTHQVLVDGVPARWVCGTHKRGLDAHLPTEVCSPAARDSACAAAAAIFRDPQMAHVVCRPCDVEVSIFWTELRNCGFTVQGEHGPLWREAEAPIRFKARLDFFAPPYQGEPWMIVDLKKMQRGKGSRFERAKIVERYNWHRQAAHYVRALRRWKGLQSDVPVGFGWLFVEDSPPYDAVWFNASDLLMEIGDFELNEAIRNWGVAVCRNSFSGFQAFNGVDALNLPEWKETRYKQKKGLV